jgi:hypothetical protein
LDVLVFTPVYRLEPETVKALFALEWDGPLSFLLQRDNPYQRPDGTNEGKLNHLHQYQRGRETFLRGPYEAMLVIESDIIPPPDALKRLAALNVDVAYGVYVFRPGGVVNVFERYRERGGKPARNTGESLTVRDGLWDQALRAGVVECSGGGLGCILIKRQVLEAVEFRLIPGNGHCDTSWTYDVYQRGYKMMADTKVLCGHISEEGEVWPSA